MTTCKDNNDVVVDRLRVRKAPHHTLTKKLVMIFSALYPRLKPGAGMPDVLIMPSLSQRLGTFFIRTMSPSFTDCFTLPISFGA
jgi:hypothetical protein